MHYFVFAIYLLMLYNAFFYFLHIFLSYFCLLSPFVAITEGVSTKGNPCSTFLTLKEEWYLPILFTVLFSHLFCPILCSIREFCKSLVKENESI